MIFTPVEVLHFFTDQVEKNESEEAQGKMASASLVFAALLVNEKDIISAILNILKELLHIHEVILTMKPDRRNLAFDLFSWFSVIIFPQNRLK